MRAVGDVWIARFTMLGVVLCWSAAFTFIKIALRHLTPFDVTLLRFLAAALPLAAVALWKGWPRIRRDEIYPFLVVSLVTVTVYHFSLNWGETRVSAGVAALIVGTGPMWTAVFSSLMGRERLTPVKGAGILLALAGVGVIVTGSGEGLTVPYGVGALVLLLAPVSWAYATVLAKPLVMRHGSEPVAASTTLAGTALILPILFTGTVDRAITAPSEAWGAVLFLALGATVFGYLGFNASLKRLTPTETMAFVYLNPVFGLGWSFLILFERPSLLTLAGGAVVIAGVVLATWRVKKREAAPTGEAEGASVEAR